MADVTTSTLEFPYVRTLGPVVGRYVAGLAQSRLLGIRTQDRVLVPPVEWDPETGEPLALDLVEVGPAGTVATWTWVPEPYAMHPLDRPFAFALITLDGADTPLLHAVDAGSPDAMRSGLRVRPVFRDEPQGATTDLLHFVPLADGETLPAVTGQAAAVDVEALEPVTTMEFWSSLTYSEVQAPSARRYGIGLESGHLVGQKCPSCRRVYTPPTDVCSAEGKAMDETHDVDLGDTGTITNFTVVLPVQYHGQTKTEPFARVAILLDAEDAVMQLQVVLDLPAAEIRSGMRVKAVWAEPGAERGEDAQGRLLGWRATGEPDRPVTNDLLDRVM